MIRHITITLMSLLILALPAGRCNAGDTEAEIRSTADIPSLIESVRLPDSLSFLGKPVPVHDQDVRERLEKELLLALWDRPQVVLWLKRASKYFGHLETILNQEDVPLDLKYVAVIESGLRPHAGSHAGAIGYWQFMRSTGAKQGLRVDSEIDERRNLFRSTRAACRYLKELHGIFHSWPLALAAYNMGEHGLEAEIRMQKTTDYYSLYLSLETQRYLFKVLAAKMIMENPEFYGFYLEDRDRYPELAFDTVTIDSPARVPLVVIAEAAGAGFKEIKDLNPEIRGYYLAKGKHEIAVPRGRSSGFERKLTAALASWRAENGMTVHVVKAGENLSLIAQKYDIPLGSLLRWNNLNVNSFIHPGDRLVVYLN